MYSFARSSDQELGMHNFRVNRKHSSSEILLILLAICRNSKYQDNIFLKKTSSSVCPSLSQCPFLAIQSPKILNNLKHCTPPLLHSDIESIKKCRVHRIDLAQYCTRGVSPYMHITCEQSGLLSNLIYIACYGVSIICVLCKFEVTCPVSKHYFEVATTRHSEASNETLKS